MLISVLVLVIYFVGFKLLFVCNSMLGVIVFGFFVGMLGLLLFGLYLLYVVVVVFWLVIVVLFWLGIVFIFIGYIVWNVVIYCSLVL